MRYKSIQQFGKFTAVASNNCGQCLAVSKDDFCMYHPVERAAKSGGEILWGRRENKYVVVSSSGVVALPPDFIGVTLDDDGIVYGSSEGLAATFHDGDVRTYGPGRIIATNSSGMTVGTAIVGEEAEFPRIWRDGIVIWEGDKPGTCVDLNESGLVGVNLFHGYDENFGSMQTTAHTWTAGAGLTSMKALHDDTEWTGVSFVDDDGVILGFQVGPYVPDERASGDLQATTGIIWENSEPRKIPISSYGKGLVPFFRGPNGEIFGVHSIPAELPMCLGHDWDDGFFCHHNGFTENLDSLIDGWIYVTGLGGIDRKGQIFANLSHELCLLGPDDEFFAKKIAQERRLLSEYGYKFTPAARKSIYGQDYDDKLVEEGLSGARSTFLYKLRRWFSGEK